MGKAAKAKLNTMPRVLVAPHSLFMNEKFASKTSRNAQNVSYVVKLVTGKETVNAQRTPTVAMAKVPVLHPLLPKTNVFQRTLVRKVDLLFPLKAIMQLRLPPQCIMLPILISMIYSTFLPMTTFSVITLGLREHLFLSLRKVLLGGGTLLDVNKSSTVPLLIMLKREQKIVSPELPSANNAQIFLLLVPMEPIGDVNAVIAV